MLYQVTLIIRVNWFGRKMTLDSFGSTIFGFGVTDLYVSPEIVAI